MATSDPSYPQKNLFRCLYSLVPSKFFWGLVFVAPHDDESQIERRFEDFFQTQLEVDSSDMLLIPVQNELFAGVTVAPAIQNCSKCLPSLCICLTTAVPKYRVISRTPLARHKRVKFAAGGKNNLTRNNSCNRLLLVVATQHSSK